ncbi:MAG: hypothetical protein WA642_16240 [Steroidobacteraceae bacterium]
MNKRRAFLGVTGALIVGLGGCASSQIVLVGQPRPAIPPAQVQIYLEPPESPYREIANLSASSRGSLAVTAAAKMDKVVTRLKEAAASVGANGVLLHGVSDQTAAALGAGIGTDSSHSPYVRGVGTSVLFSREAGDGIAIFVEPNREN